MVLQHNKTSQNRTTTTDPLVFPQLAGKEPIIYFPIAAASLYPGEGANIGFHRVSHILTISRARGKTLCSVPFTFSEACVAIPLFLSVPNYCPNEVLHLCQMSQGPGAILESQVEEARELLKAALEEGTFDQSMRPARNVLSRVRVKLRKAGVGLSITVTLQTGYTLHSLLGIPRPVYQLPSEAREGEGENEDEEKEWGNEEE